MVYYSVSPDEEANVIYLKHITITVLKHINYRENLGYITVMKHLKVVYLKKTESPTTITVLYHAHYSVKLGNNTV